MSIRISGKEVSEAIRAQLKEECASLIREHGVHPALAVVLVGNNPASETYVANKKKACEELGYAHKDFTMSSDTTEAQLLDLIRELNADESVHGILVQLPLPSQIREDAVIEAISPEKDVDGFHSVNAGLLLQGKPVYIPCTPKGILALLDYYHIPTDGKRVCVIGRSNIVGKPVAALLMQKGRDATVTVCNTHTKDLKSETLRSDIIIVASGHPDTLTADMVSEGVTIIDVGINRVEDSSRERGWRLVGDVDYAGCKEKAYAITPVPGGVGPMTITMLMENTLIAAKRKAGL